jgi:hypothetical protein
MIRGTGSSALASASGDYARSDFFAAMVLADAHLDRGDLNEGCRIAAQAINVGDCLDSVRCRGYVGEFRQRLARHRSGSEVLRRAGATGRCWCGQTRPTTATTSSPLPAGPGPGSPNVVKAITSIRRAILGPDPASRTRSTNHEQRWVSDVARWSDTGMTASTVQERRAMLIEPSPGRLGGRLHDVLALPGRLHRVHWRGDGVPPDSRNLWA